MIARIPLRRPSQANLHFRVGRPDFLTGLRTGALTAFFGFGAPDVFALGFFSGDFFSGDFFIAVLFSAAAFSGNFFAFAFGTAAAFSALPESLIFLTTTESGVTGAALTAGFSIFSAGLSSAIGNADTTPPIN